ncbi:uncharacterized protein LOC112542181 [Python bivittatus]|uniref:Uncharacterized protein LOC112542181 n=1 Tax=Python bivittatus TaxID=176946 RepID=A0A9F5MXM7_PYTBI|nr:uncharacterized protein LOC112542181 [Python bivittatus]
MELLRTLQRGLFFSKAAPPSSKYKHTHTHFLWQTTMVLFKGSSAWIILLFWLKVPGGDSFLIQNVRLQKCIHASPHKAEKVSLSDCKAHSPQHQWRWDRAAGAVVNEGTRQCLAASRAEEFAAAQLETCGEGAHQAWSCSKKGHLTLQGRSLHLSVKPGGHDAFLSQEKGRFSKWKTGSGAIVCATELVRAPGLGEPRETSLDGLAGGPESKARWTLAQNAALLAVCQPFEVVQAGNQNHEDIKQPKENQDWVAYKCVNKHFDPFTTTIELKAPGQTLLPSENPEIVVLVAQQDLESCQDKTAGFLEIHTPSVGAATFPMIHLESQSNVTSGLPMSSDRRLEADNGLSWRTALLVLSPLAFILGVILLMLSIQSNKKKRLLALKSRQVSCEEQQPLPGSVRPSSKIQIIPASPSPSLKHGEILIEWKDGTITSLFDSSH